MQISSVNSLWNAFSANGAASSKSAQYQSVEEKNEAYELALSDQAQAYMASGQSMMDRLSNPSFAQNLPEDLQNSMDDIQERLNRLLVSRNLGTDETLEFTVDENGFIRLTSEHPDKEAIEQAINGNEEFVGDLKETLNKGRNYAASEANEKYVKLMNDEDDEDKEKKVKENEYERQLRLTEKVAKIQEQISSVSGNFSLQGGKLSLASVAMAQNMSF